MLEEKRSQNDVNTQVVKEKNKARRSLLGVISDTHAADKTTIHAYDEFEQLGVERVLHCGDVARSGPFATLGNLDVFKRIPTDFVLGNCDVRWEEELATKLENVGGRLFGLSGELEWEGKRVFWTHGHIRNSVEEAALSERWDLICCGHTHQYKLKRQKSTIVLNPGSVQSGFDVDFPSCCVVDSELNVWRIALPESFF